MRTIEYVDFNLTFDRVGQNYRVKASCSLCGEATGVCPPPFTQDEIKQFIQDMGFHRSEDQQFLKAISSRERAAQDLGRRLFEAALPRAVRERFLSALARHHAGEAPGLRLKLYLTGAPELADLPWEFLYPGEDFDFPALSTRTPIVRYPDVPRPVPALRVILPLQVLALVVRPVGYLVPNPDREQETLNHSLAPLVAKRWAQVRWLVNPTREQFQQELRRKAYHVLHFVGHGIFETQAQDGFLVLADERGYEDPLDSVRLRRLLGDCPSLRLAVLIACEGARTGRVDPFAGIAATLVRGGIPAVVAMQFPITYGAAADFAAGLYRALADQYPVDAAIGEGRKTVDLQSPGTVEWGIPVLYMRSDDGKIFDVEAAPVRPQAPSPELDDRYRRALELFYDQHMDGARDLLEEVIAEAPDYPGAYEKLEIARRIAIWENEARLLRQAGRWKEVRATLDHVHELVPEYSDPHGHQAWAEGERRRNLPSIVYRKGLESLLPEEQEELGQIDGQHGLRNLAKELADSGRWETLHRLVAEGDDRQPWAEARREMEGGYAGYLTDLKLAWRHAEEVGATQARRGEAIIALGQQVRYTAIASSIQLVLAGKPMPPLANRYILAITLAALAPTLSSYPDLLAQIMGAVSNICSSEALRVVRIKDDFRAESFLYEAIADALADLAPSLSEHPHLLAQALDTAGSIDDDEYHAMALCVLSPALAGHRRLVAQALDSARSIDDKSARAMALAALLPHLSEDTRQAILAEALDAAQGIRYDQAGLVAVPFLTLYLANDLRQGVLAEALEAACNTKYDPFHQRKLSQSLTILAPSLGTYPELLVQALDAASSIMGKSESFDAFAALAPSLARHPDLFAQALDTVRSSSNVSSRFWGLAALAPHLPHDLRQEVLAQALDEIGSIAPRQHGWDEYSEPLAAIASSLAGQSDLLAKALDIAFGINDETSRLEVLSALAADLPDDLRKKALTKALDAAHDIDSFKWKRSRPGAVPKFESDRPVGPLIQHLLALVPLLAEYPDLRVRFYSLWSEMLRSYASVQRLEFLEVLAERASILVALGGDEVAVEAANGILDVHRWWPISESGQQGQEG